MGTCDTSDAVVFGQSADIGYGDYLEPYLTGSVDIAPGATDVSKTLLSVVMGIAMAMLATFCSAYATAGTTFSGYKRSVFDLLVQLVGPESSACRNMFLEYALTVLN
ncbi:MAG: hypothetical protein ACR5K7_02935 [Symbiopectobacterium sp.]